MEFKPKNTKEMQELDGTREVRGSRRNQLEQSNPEYLAQADEARKAKKDMSVQEKIKKLQELRGEPRSYVEDPSLTRAINTNTTNTMTPTAVPAPVNTPIAPADPNSVEQTQEAPVADVVQEEPIVNPISGLPIAQSAKQKLEDAVTLEQEAVIKGAQAGAAQAEAEASYIQNMANQQQQMQQANMQKQMEREEQMQQQMQQLNSKIEEISAQEIDPDRYWNNRSTGQKILAGIGMAFGAFGGPGGNRAVKVIQNSIDQDIKAQMENIKNKRTGAAQAQTLVGQMQQSFNNMNQIESAATAAAYQNVQLQLQAMANKYKSPQIQAQAQQIFAQLEQKKQEANAKFQAQAALMAQSPTGKPLTKGQEKVDEDYAKNYNQFTEKGRKNAENTIKKLTEYRDRLRDEADDLFQSGGGRIAQALPDFLRTDESIEFRDQIPLAANKTLKELFGGQLSDAERESAAREFYNDRFGPEKNAEILTGKIKELQDNLNVQTEKAKYYEKFGTLQGWEGSTTNPVTKDAPSDNVKVQDPKGRVRVIPRRLLDAAILAGGKLVE